MQRAIVALGEALAHSVGPSEKRRLLAFTPPTFPWTEYWLRCLLHSPHSCLLCAEGLSVERRRGAPPGLVERSARHCTSIDCPGPSYAIRPWKPSCASFWCSLRAANTPCLAQVWGAPCTHARPLPVSGSSLCVPVRVEVHASKRAAFPRRMSVHFRVSFLNVFLASPSNGLLSDPISPYLPASPLN